MTPVSAAPSLPAFQFTVCTSRFTRLRQSSKYLSLRSFAVAVAKKKLFVGEEVLWKTSMISLCDPSRELQESLGPSGPETPKKSEKNLPLPEVLSSMGRARCCVWAQTRPLGFYGNVLDTSACNLPLQRGNRQNQRQQKFSRFTPTPSFGKICFVVVGCNKAFPSVKQSSEVGMSNRGQRPRGQRKSGTSRKCLFGTFSRPFPDFLGPSGPGRLFSDFFGVSRARGARETPVARGRVRKSSW